MLSSETGCQNAEMGHPSEARGLQGRAKSEGWMRVGVNVQIELNVAKFK